MPRETHGTETITIAGQPFQAPLRYAEGHELTVGEASQLNQVYHENLRNNFAKKVKEAVDAGSFDEAAFQSMFDEYADQYEMGVRTGGGGGTRDPVHAEALRIAKDLIKSALKRKGKKLNEVEASAVTDAAEKLLARGDDRANEIHATARKRVEEVQAAASDDLSDLIGEIPARQQEAAE